MSFLLNETVNGCVSKQSGILLDLNWGNIIRTEEMMGSPQKDTIRNIPNMKSRRKLTLFSKKLEKAKPA
jgi:hypothetical protein